MRVRLKKQGILKNSKLESVSRIDEVFIKEDFSHPNKEVISLFFKGDNSSGIIDFTKEELEMLLNSLKNKKDLIKEFKVLKFDK